MKAFIVPEGVKVAVIKKGKEWYDDNFEHKVTNKESMFFVEDITVDPVGRLGIHRGFVNTVGGMYAKDGFYGFSLSANSQNYETMLVHASDVEVG